MKERYLEAGKVTRLHGFKGLLKLETWSDSPSALEKVANLYIKQKDLFSAYCVEKITCHKDGLLVKFKNIDDEKAASAFVGKTLYADRDEIVKDENSFFIADLIGLDVIDEENGRVYGKLSDVIQYGNRDVYSVKTGSGEVLIPAVGEFIKKIDPENGIFVHVIGGMFDEV